MLEGQFPIGLLDIVFAGVAIDAEQFVVVFLGAQARSSRLLNFSTSKKAPLHDDAGSRGFE
jgi:hypothetical protein